MKKLIFIQALMAIMMMLACRPENFKQVGEPANYMEQIPGNYTLSRVVQSDVKALKNNYPYKSLDVTNIFPYTEYQLTLNSNGAVPGTFSSVQGNAPPVIRLHSGTWNVDNTQAPKIMYFINGNDSVKIEIGNYTAFRNNKLSLRLVKYLDGKAVTNYDYEFTKK